MNTKNIKSLVDAILPEITEIRHSIHKNPELGRKEFKTSAMVRSTLASTKAGILPPFLETDVVALLEGNGPGKNVTLRADMDALQIEEQTDLPYSSQNPGIMHACGHDGHTAMLIGSALVLNKLTDDFSGSVRFVFQPGEEMLCLGKALVEAGALKNPEPAVVTALHAWPGIPEGTIAAKTGRFMAATKEFRIIVKGRGGHGARPHSAIDPILTAARIVEALQAVSSRIINPCEPLVLSVCSINGGGAANVIPDNVEITGTIRFFSKDVGIQISKSMERIIKGVCDSMGATYELHIDGKYIPLINDADVIDTGRRVTTNALGEENWIDLEHPTMTAEDFAFYLQDYPGALFRVGMGNPCSLHNSGFDFSDGALKNGIMFNVLMALSVCNKEKE